MVIFTNKKRDRTPKVKFVSPEEFWTKERVERARRSSEPIPNEEQYLRFMHEAMKLEGKRLRAQEAKQRGEEATLVGHQDTKPK